MPFLASIFLTLPCRKKINFQNYIFLFPFSSTEMVELTVKFFNTPEGWCSEQKLEVPNLATVLWVARAVHSLWSVASSRDGYISFGKPFDAENYFECDFLWNRNGFGLDVKHNPDAPALPYFVGDSPVLLVQICQTGPAPLPPPPAVPQHSLDDYNVKEYENGKYIAIDNAGKEHMVLMERDTKRLTKLCESYFATRCHAYFDHPEHGLAGVIYKQSRAEWAEERAEMEAKNRRRDRHRCIRPPGQGADKELSVMTEDNDMIYVAESGFYQCIMDKCHPFDDAWLDGARLLDFDKVLIPMQNYRTMLGLFVIDVETKELTVYRLAGTHRTIIDAHRNDIFTLMLKYIADEMALVNPQTAFRAESWACKEYSVPAQGEHKFDLCRIVYEIMHGEVQF